MADIKERWAETLKAHRPATTSAHDDEPKIDVDLTKSALDQLFTLTGRYRSSKAYYDLLQFSARFRWYSPFNPCWSTRNDRARPTSRLPRGRAPSTNAA